MKYVVIGGAGAMGRITVRDLYETCRSDDEVVIADFDIQKAQEVKTQLDSLRRSGAPEIAVAKVDVTDEMSTQEALRGATCAINCVHYQYNVNVMRACLRVGVHYVDLGGLFHTTLKQAELHREFEVAGLTAILGMGAAPGITNVLARHAADQLDSVEEIHCRVAGTDQSKYEYESPLSVSYSLKTILEEFSFKPAVFRKGKMTFVEPMSGAEPVKFPAPIGTVKPMFTIHSEVATLPQSFACKGVKEVSFKIAFDPTFVDRVRFLRDFGLASHEPVTVKGASIAPIDFINNIAMNYRQPRRVGKMKQYEVVRTVVCGTKKKKKVSFIVDCHTKGMPKWGVGLDIDTGAPPSIGAQMIAHGVITARGAIPAEVAVPVKPFFKELSKRGMKVTSTQKSGWAQCY